MQSRKHSDGAVSPTGHPNGNGNRSRVNTTNLSTHSGWDTIPRAVGIGFTGNPFATTSSNGSLRAAAAAFKPTNTDNLRSLRFLSMNSTSDDTPTIVSSAPDLKHAIQEPIGTKSASTNTSSLHTKVWFTTDVDPNKPPMGGHFLLIQDVKDCESPNGVIALIEDEYNDEILGKKLIKQGEHGDHTDVVLYVNDCRCTTHIQADLEGEGLLTVSFVSQDWYSSGKGGVRTGSVDPNTMYVGQVTFIAEFKGRTTDYDHAINIHNAIRNVASSFGLVQGFMQIKAAQYPLWQFRVEYFKVTNAERAIAATAEGTKLEDAPGWVLFAKQYVPPTYSPVAAVKTPVELNAVQAIMPPPNGAQIIVSPTGRTAWYTGADGTDHTMPPPRAMANANRELMENSPGLWISGRHDTFGAPPPAAQRPLTAFEADTKSHYSIDSGYQGVLGNELALFAGPDAPRPQDIVVARIFNGLDVRTTVMLRNVPHDWTWKHMKSMLDTVSAGRYNFMYLRMDFKQSKNVGYAFVNFENALDICNLVQRYVGQPWDTIAPPYSRPKLVQVSYATIQGLDSLIEKFRNSAVMDESPDFRPALYQTAEEKAKDEFENAHMMARGLPPSPVVEVGERKLFPTPNNHAKKERSTANAGQIGLFSPRTNRNIADRWYRSQYDRGTPAQLMEDFNHGTPYTGPPQPAMVPPHVASFQFGGPRFQAVYPPQMGLPYQQHPFGYLAAPGCILPPRPGFMPEVPARSSAPGMPSVDDHHVPSHNGQ